MTETRRLLNKKSRSVGSMPSPNIGAKRAK